jgi:TIR domain
MPPATKRWDVFISHASEDKEVVALPLAKALEGAAVRVWLDQERLQIGDSLRASIDEGASHESFRCRDH